MVQAREQGTELWMMQDWIRKQWTERWLLQAIGQDVIERATDDAGDEALDVASEESGSNEIGSVSSLPHIIGLIRRDRECD